MGRPRHDGHRSRANGSVHTRCNCAALRLCGDCTLPPVVAVVATSAIVIPVAIVLMAATPAVIVTAVPTTVVHLPAARTLLPARLAPVVTRSAMLTIAATPDIAAIAPLPVTWHPHVARLYDWHGLILRGRRRVRRPVLSGRLLRRVDLGHERRRPPRKGVMGHVTCVM